MYSIDAYALTKNWIVLLLALSAVLMAFVGYHFHTEKKKVHDKSKIKLSLAIICAAIIFIIALLSATPIGFSKTEFIPESLPLEKVFVIKESDGRENPYERGPSVYSLTYKNTFLPRQKVLPRVHACLYNSEKRTGTYLTTRWQTEQIERGLRDFDHGENVARLGIGEKTVSLELMPHVFWKPRPGSFEIDGVPAKPVPVPDFEQQKFDTVLLFISEESGMYKGYYPCESLQPSEVETAKKIRLV